MEGEVFVSTFSLMAISSFQVCLLSLIFWRLKIEGCGRIPPQKRVRAGKAGAVKIVSPEQAT